MDRPPRSAKDRIVDGRLVVRSLLWLGTLQTALCFVGFFFLWRQMGYTGFLHLPRPDLLPYAERLLSRDGLVYVLATTMFHAGVITTQIGNAYACRTERTSVFKIGFLSNRFLLFGFLVELAIISILIYLPPFQAIFEHGPLPLRFWPFLLLYAPVMFLAEEGRKALVRRFEAKRLTRRAKVTTPPTREGDRGSGNVLRREESVQSKADAEGTGSGSRKTHDRSLREGGE